MIDKFIHLSVMSGGLLPLMGVLLLVTLAVIIERSWFFHRVLKSGLAMEHDLQLVEYQNWDKLEQIAAHYEGSLQRSIDLLGARLARPGRRDHRPPHRRGDHVAAAQDRRYVWVLDTAVTLAPLMGLLGTIIGMVHAFDILGTRAPAARPPRWSPAASPRPWWPPARACSSPSSRCCSSTISTSASGWRCTRWICSRSW